MLVFLQVSEQSFVFGHIFAASDDFAQSYKNIFFLYFNSHQTKTNLHTGKFILYRGKLYKYTWNRY